MIDQLEDIFLGGRLNKKINPKKRRGTSACVTLVIYLLSRFILYTLFWHFWSFASLLIAFFGLNFGARARKTEDLFFLA